MKNPHPLHLIFSLLLLSSCGMNIEWSHPQSQQAYSMDGIKLISKDISRVDDGAAFAQERYTLSPSQRLLLRFEDLSSKISSIQLSGGKTVELEVTLTDPSQQQMAQRDLLVCPVLQNWMMLATWENAHPFGRDGIWSSPGGNFDLSGCVTAKRTSDHTLFFDITQWVIDYPRGRNQNFGQILKSNSIIEIYGDKSGSFSPKIHWTQ